MHKYKGVNWFAFTCFFLLVAMALLSCGTQREVRILHVNDFHGFAVPYKPHGSNEVQGGLAYLADKADILREEKPSLLLAAGDMIQGNTWANLFQGKSTIEAMNAMRFDAMVVGNHEFDFGREALETRISEAGFPVLGANVAGVKGLKPYAIREVNGLRVAVIGVVTADTPVSTHPKNVVGLEFTTPMGSVAKHISEVKDKSDIIVVLSHLGRVADEELARKVAGINLIVGGHSHTKLERPVMVGNTAIVQAFEHAKTLGIVDLAVRDGIVRARGRLEHIQPLPGNADKTVAAIVEKYQKPVDERMSQIVGETGVDLDGEYVRSRETNLGDLVADIIRETSGADVAIINGGGIRTSIARGPIKVNDVHSAVSDNYIVAIKLTGTQVRETLEHGVSGVEERAGRFPQVSGLMFTYDRSCEKGKRVGEILVGGKPLVPDREYAVATNDFVAAGGDGYKTFGDAVRSSGDFSIVGGAIKGEKIVYNDPGRGLRDVVIEYIKARKRVAPVVEGRIREAAK
ncbi:MAG: Trifunctional nucleotide phosphoesterase protein YfkN precursor [Syntrophorhabdus sp. PtaU1.Bin153]|nr:MAG: Trifunctional nucleotide phosphoesterase protein YfkN precursor [Syntrophorhabdus sp. PtaU1.Bin153]